MHVYLFIFPINPHSWETIHYMQGAHRLSKWRATFTSVTIFSVLLLIRINMDKIMCADFVGHLTSTKKHKCDCSFQLCRWVVIKFLKGKIMTFMQIQIEHTSKILSNSLINIKINKLLMAIQGKMWETKFSQFNKY
jgi:hypothetical protein